MSTTEIPTRETPTVTVEASTAERALAEVNSRLGPDAVILDARKIRKGGVAGFFATELVRLEAKPGASGISGLDAFGDSLRAALDESDDDPDSPAQVIAVGPAVRPAPAGTPPHRELSEDPVEAAWAGPGAWRLAGEIRWDSGRLARLDIPAQILDAVTGVDPRDDLGWIAAISGAVAPWCRPLPRGASEFVGSGSERLASALMKPGDVDSGYPLVERYGHLVVDERGAWDSAFGDEVLAVSWSRTGGAPTALRLAASMGLVLGYGMTDALGAPALRLTAVDVALTVRELVARR